MKICTDCKLEKPLSEFSLVKRNKNVTHYGETHYKSICRECGYKRVKEWRKLGRRNSSREHIVSKYKITWDKYNELVNQSDNTCAICYHEFVTPHIDHDHNTGLIRGVLCMQCNLAIGLLMHDPRIIRQAAEYLESFSGRVNKSSEDT